MAPQQLSAASFSSYPPEARQFAAAHLELLRQMPLTFLPLLLRELIVYDWKFPAERADLDRQFAYLHSLSPEAFQSAMAPFRQLKIKREMEQTDWVNAPAVFSEQLSAHLWATHQIDGFRAAAVEYVRRVSASAPDPALPVHRLGIAVLGQGVAGSEYRLFRKLRLQGTYFTHVNPGGGMKVVLEAAALRAKAHPAPFGHWYIDGGAGLPVADGITRISYQALSGPRAAIQARMQKTYEAAVFDPEAFRTMLAQMKPDEAGFPSGADEVLNRFQLSLLTEGSGTQVFATTFVQWAAREALRRAQPLTLVTRYAPRQREKQMNELLAERQRPPELDPPGSLIDADMGAYYTWLNQQRLAGEKQAAFLAWFEDHGEAMAIGPEFEPGKHYENPIDLSNLVVRVV